MPTNLLEELYSDSCVINRLAKQPPPAAWSMSPSGGGQGPGLGRPRMTSPLPRQLRPRRRRRRRRRLRQAPSQPREASSKPQPPKMASGEQGGSYLEADLGWTLSYRRLHCSIDPLKRAGTVSGVIITIEKSHSVGLQNPTHLCLSLSFSVLLLDILSFTSRLK